MASTLRTLRLILLLTIVTGPAWAQSTDALPDPKQEARAVTLGSELRCVVCQSESINDSQAEMARDLRVLVREKIADGWSDQQIREFARDRYGDFILLKPPVQPNTYLLWALPLLFLGMAVTLVVTLLRKRKNEVSAG